MRPKEKKRRARKETEAKLRAALGELIDQGLKFPM